YNLAHLYKKGHGVAQSDEQALKWYTKAAEHNESDAQYNLAQMYLNGEGTPKNLQLAKKWFQQAANTGDVDAKEMLKSLE
ncbi:tetratricopeptide repeat protein, partial [Acinetobacter baumannii]